MSHRSVVWKYFLRIEKGQAECNECKAVLKCQDGNTTGLLNHYNVFHDESGKGLKSNPKRKKTSEHFDFISVKEESVELACKKGDGMEEVEGDFVNKSFQKSKKEACAYTHKSRSKSIVWNHFGKISKEEAECKMCKRVLRCSTSGLLKHLSSKHSDVFEDLESQKLKADEIVANTTGNGEPSFQSLTESDSPFLNNLSLQNVDTPTMMNKSRSRIWKYFHRIDSKNAECNKCKGVLECCNGSISNLMLHYNTNHGIVLTSNRRKNFPESVLGVISIEEEIARMTCKDGLSFRVIAQSEFIQRGLYQGTYGKPIPTSSNDVRIYMMNYYNEIKMEFSEFFKIEVDKGQRYSLTLKEYTSRKNRRYIEINVHGEKVQWNLGLVCVKEESFDSQSAVELVEQHLQEFSLDMKRDIVACTTDGATSMMNLGSLIDPLHQKCIAHGLNLSICDVLYSNISTLIPSEQDGMVEEDRDDDDFIDEEEEEEEEDKMEIELTEVKPIIHNDYNFLIKKIRRICRIFKKPLLENGDLQKILKKMNSGQQLSLIVDVKTRWDSLLHMLERFLLLKDCIKEAFFQEDMVSDEEWSEIQNIIDVLKLLEISLKELTSEDASLLKAESSFIFIMNKIKNRKDNLSIALMQSLTYRFSFLRQKEVIGLIQYLYNPNYEPSEFQAASQEDFKVLAESIYRRLYPDAEEDDTTRTISSKADDTQYDDPLLRQYYNELNKLKSNTKPNKALQCFDTEFKIYECTGKRTEKLDRLFSALLTIKPISIDSEKLFSTSILFPSRIRKRRSDATLNAEVFLNNYFLNNF